MDKITVSNGIHWVAIPEENLFILCGCPADSVKHLYKAGLIKKVEKDGIKYETGPNAVLLSDVSMQRGAFCNLAEFPVLQMLYRQGMILPKHPGNTGRKPMLIGLPEQVKSQSEYIYRGNYGLRGTDELEEAGADPELARLVDRMKRKFSFDRILETSALLDLRPIERDAVQLSENVFLYRKGVNLYAFLYKGESVEVDLNLEYGEEYLPPFDLASRPFRRGYFDVVHIGEGDGWDPRRPCMASIVVFQGRIYLIDAGPNILYSLTSLGIGIGEIAGIFQTHAHDDHCAGLTALIRSDHRIAYYAASIVRLSVAKKVCALMGIDEDSFSRYFDVRDLEIGAWNEVSGLEVRPVLSPHPVETTVFFFRARAEEGYKTYAHLADIAAFSVLDSMRTEDPAKSGISPDLEQATKSAYLETVDLKKIDIGGGLIHGNAADFASDETPRKLLSHTDRALTEAELKIGRNAQFGEEDELIGARRDYAERLALDALRTNFPDVSESAVSMLANCPIEEFAPGAVLIGHGDSSFPVYLILTGVIEYLDAGAGIRNLLSSGFMAGDAARLAGTGVDGTYRAVGSVSALRIPGSLYLEFIRSNSLAPTLERLRENRDFLRKTNLCGEIVSCTLQLKIAYAMEKLTLRAGASVPSDGDPFLYVVASGALSVLSRNHQIETVGRGGFVGEERILYDSTVLYSATAATETELFRLSANLIADIPLVLWKLQEAFERRVRVVGSGLKVAWYPEYSVGIPELDAEHRDLFENFGAVARVFEGPDLSARRAKVEEIVRKAHSHFSHEERLMTENNCPELARQKRAHAGFLAEMEGYLSESGERLLAGSDRFVVYLRNWLIRHSLGEDRRYVEFFRKIGPRP